MAAAGPRGAVVLALALLAGCHHGGETAAEDEGASVRVKAKAAEQRTIADKVAGLGRCEAIPQWFAALTATAEGKVIHLLKQPGDHLEAGAAIVELDSTIAGKNLKEKEAARDSLKASLALLESLPRAEEQNSAKLAIEQAQVTVEKARSNVNRLRPLRARGEIPETTMYDAESALRQAELQAKTAQAQYDVLMLRPRPQAIAEAKSRIDAAQTAIGTAKAQIEQLTIRTPIAGVLNSLTCQLGQTLSIGTAVGEVVDSSRLNVVVWLSVVDAQRVALQQAAQVFACDATGRPRSHVTGKVQAIGQIADPQTGNLPVRILVENADGKLKVGQAVYATIVVREEKVLAVPVQAVHESETDTTINVVRDGKAVILHRPKQGLKDEQWVEVRDTDLKPGEPVVVEGGYNLPDGTKVEVETVGEDKPDEAKDQADKAKGPAEKPADEKRPAEKAAEGEK